MRTDKQTDYRLEYYDVRPPYAMIEVPSPNDRLRSGDRWRFALDCDDNPDIPSIGQAYYGINSTWIASAGPGTLPATAYRMFGSVDAGADGSSNNDSVRFNVVVRFRDDFQNPDTHDGNFRCRVYQHSGQSGANDFGGPPAGYKWIGEYDENPAPFPVW